MRFLNAALRLLKYVFQITYRSVSKVGTMLRWDWLTYNYGVHLSFRRLARRNAPRVVKAVVTEFPEASSLADVGCGTGIYAAAFQQRGLIVMGCEYSRRARRMARRLGVHVVPLDVSKASRPLQGSPYDLAISLEVAEHVPPAYADDFVRFVARASDHVVFTAAHPGQKLSIGHVNEQPKAYWIQKFVNHGYVHDEAVSRRIANRLKQMDAASFLHKNMMVFHRADPSESVRGGKPHAGAA